MRTIWCINLRLLPDDARDTQLQMLLFLLSLWLSLLQLLLLLLWLLLLLLFWLLLLLLQLLIVLTGNRFVRACSQGQCNILHCVTRLAFVVSRLELPSGQRQRQRLHLLLLHHEHLLLRLPLFPFQTWKLGNSNAYRGWRCTFILSFRFSP